MHGETNICAIYFSSIVSTFIAFFNANTRRSASRHDYYVMSDISNHIVRTHLSRKYHKWMPLTGWNTIFQNRLTGKIGGWFIFQKATKIRPINTRKSALPKGRNYVWDVLNYLKCSFPHLKCSFWLKRKGFWSVRKWVFGEGEYSSSTRSKILFKGFTWRPEGIPEAWVTT